MKYSVEFKHGENSLKIDLYSHYTCIYGDCSGEGKTEFIANVLDGLSDGSVEIQSELPVSISDVGSIQGLLELPNRRIIVIDELSMLGEEIIKKINSSQHLFIGISRGNPLGLNYSAQSIYRLHRTETWFKVERIKDLSKSITFRNCNMNVKPIGKAFR